MSSFFLKICSILLLIGALASHAGAAAISFQFSATLQTGNLAGTAFTGTGAYDNHDSTGIGTQYFVLTALNFDLLGAAFTRADITQGGQAIVQDGTLSYFTAAFFPPLPLNAPVNDIAFGFGGPGIIGYSTPPGFNSGSGSYTLSGVAAPEPATLGIATLTLLVLWASAQWRRTRVVTPLALVRTPSKP